MISSPPSNSYFESQSFVWSNFSTCGLGSSSQVRVDSACGSRKDDIAPRPATPTQPTSRPGSLPLQTLTPTITLLASPRFLPSSTESFSRPGRAVEGDWKAHPLASAAEKFIIETVAMYTDPLALAGIEWSDDGATMANRFIRHGLRHLRR